MPAHPTIALPFFAGACLAGACWAAQLPASVWWAAVPLLVGWLARRLVRPRWLIGGFLLGALWAALPATWNLTGTLPPEPASLDAWVTGRVSGLPQYDHGVTRFMLEIIALEPNPAAVSLRRIRVADYRDEPVIVNPGEAWRLPLRLKPPAGMANPGGFDYQRWLFSQGVGATAYLRDTAGGQRLPQLDGQARIDRLRQRISEHVRESLPGSTLTGLLSALAVGDRRDIDAQQWQTLRLTGTGHLVAISGLHIGLLAGLIYWLALRLWASLSPLALWLPAPKAAIVLALGGALAYSLLAGFALPTRRALAMLVLLILARWLDRRVRPLHLLALCLLLVLLDDPLGPLGGSFWLSFGAVAALLFVDQWRHAGHQWWEVLRVQWRLALLLAPLTAVLFQQVALSGPLANILAIPLVTLLVVPLVLLATLIFLLSGDGAVEYLCLAVAERLLAIGWPLLESLAAAPTGGWPAFGSGVVQVGLAVTMLCLFLPRPTGLRPLALVGIGLMLWPGRDLPQHGAFELHLLDVGQGLAAVVQTREHVLLFDTGARFSDDFDAGEAVVLPVLRHLGVRRIDTLVISHGDNDHIGGAAVVLQWLPVDRVISNERIADDLRAPCRAGTGWEWDGVEFTILHPAAGGQDGGNNTSCVLMIRGRHGSALLPADIERAAERQLVERYGERLRSDVLVAPHHGSRTSSSPAFLAAVRPRYVLVPAGWRNRYRHPAVDVVERYTARGAHMLQTGACGMLTLRFAADGIRGRAYRRDRRRLWYDGRPCEIAPAGGSQAFD